MSLKNVKLKIKKKKQVCSYFNERLLKQEKKFLIEKTESIKKCLEKNNFYFFTTADLSSKNYTYKKEDSDLEYEYDDFYKSEKDPYSFDKNQRYNIFNNIFSPEKYLDISLNLKEYRINNSKDFYDKNNFYKDIDKEPEINDEKLQISKKKFHPYHIVDISPWPFLISFGLFFFTYGIAMFFHGYTGSTLLILTGFLIIILTMYTWFRDIIREAVFEGKHTKQVQLGLRNGMLLFIFSELLFFISFFWAFFHSSLSPTPEIGSLWPPLGIETINPWYIPLLNTIILLTSGATITWSHNAIVCGNKQHAVKSLILTLLLAIFFIFIQAFEYVESSFNISDGIYGTTFFLLTGFHGIHVIIGFIFILISTLRLISYHFSKQHHFGFEASAWYWHFVDVIWLFLFVSLYWWGGF